MTIDIPICLKDDCSFAEFRYLLSHNIIPILSLIALCIGFWAYVDFTYAVKGTRELSFKITEIKSKDYDHLVFLSSYIIPLLSFKLEGIRGIAVFVTLIAIICSIYIKTDLYYANPTLALLKFRTYEVTGDFRNTTTRKNKILITKDQLKLNDRVQYVKLDEQVYYAWKVKNYGQE